MASQDLPTVGELLSDSWALAKANASLTLPLVFLRIVLPATLTVCGALYFANTDNLVMTGILLLGGIVTAVFASGAYGGITEISVASVEDRATRFTIGRTGAVLLVSALLIILESIVTGPFQYAGLSYIGALISVFLTVRLDLTITIMIAEDRGVDSIAASWRFVKGYGKFIALRILSLYFILVALFVLPMLVIFVAFGMLSSAAAALGIAHNYFLMTIFGVFILGATCFSFCFEPFYRALLYRAIKLDRASAPGTSEPVRMKLGGSRA